MDRFIRLRIYDTSDTLLYDNQNDTSWGIESGSMVLDGFIMDSELKFGELTSSMFSCKVFGINEDLRGYKIIVSVGADDGIETNLLTNDGDPILTNDGENITVVQMVDNRIFTGYIVSSRTDTSELYRDIEAYDLAYDLSTKDATAFWNSFWTTNANTTVTLADIRSALLTYFSISTVTPPTFVNDDLVITNTFEGITTVTLTFGTILASICELQNTCPHFNGSGQLEFYKLGANTYNVMSQIEKYNSEWEDYTTATITGVAIYDTSDNIVKRVGTAGNFYNISGNLFLLGRTAQELDTIGGNMLTELSLITYVPAKLKFIESQLDYRFGDKLVTDRGNTYIFSNRLSGSVLIEQTTSCNALGETLGDIPSDVNDNLVNTHSMHEMKNTVDELSSIITDPTTGLESIVQQLSDKIVLKVQSDGTLALCELSADPSTGTTAFIVKAGNFSVDASGNVTITGNLTAKNKLTMQRKGSSSQIDYSTDVIDVIYGEIEVTEGNYELYQETVHFKNYKNESLISYRTPIYETSQNPMIYLNAAVMQSGGDFSIVNNLSITTGNLSVLSGSIKVGTNTVGTNAYRNASNTYNATGSTGATTTAVYNARKDVNNNLFATSWVTFDSHSVSAGALYTFQKKVTKSGYTPLGVIEFNTTNGYAYLCTSGFASDGTVSLAITNSASSAKTLTPTAKVLWVRNAIS